MARTSATSSLSLSSVYSTIGRRQYMEDYHSLEEIVLDDGSRVGLYGVYDGHGGHEVAAYVSRRFRHLVVGHSLFNNDGKEGLEEGVRMERVLREAVASMENEVKEFAKAQKLLAGTTVCFIVVRNRKVWCVNVGDSRAVLARNGGTPIALSDDHRPWRGDEKKRILSNGGFVNHMGVNGVMTVSRSLGDLDMKDLRHIFFPGRKLGERFFISEPEITETQLMGDEEFVIIASDGLWGRLANHAAADVVRKSLRKDGNVSTASYKLARSAMRAGSVDNITALLVLLNPALVHGLSVRGGSIFGRITSSRPPLTSSTAVPPESFVTPHSIRHESQSVFHAGSLTSITTLDQPLSDSLAENGQPKKEVSGGGNIETRKISSIRRFFNSRSQLSSSVSEAHSEHTKDFVGNSDPTGSRVPPVRGLFRRKSRRSRLDLLSGQSSQDLLHVQSSPDMTSIANENATVRGTSTANINANEQSNQKHSNLYTPKQISTVASSQESLTSPVTSSGSLPRSEPVTESENTLLLGGGAKLMSPSRALSSPEEDLATTLQRFTVSGGSQTA